MRKINVKTAAKINLSLDVVGKLPNGYHKLESVFQTVELYDEVSVELVKGNNIMLTCEATKLFATDTLIPCDQRNIAYKAARNFLDVNKINTGVHIHIKKNIPSQAGMGGGSTDAAAVLYCLGKLTGKTFSAPEKLGADVPFFLIGGTAFVSGIGEKIEPISDYSGQIIVIAKGTHGVSTVKAYSLIDSIVTHIHYYSKSLVNSINNDPKSIPKFIGNLFEKVIYLEEVNNIKLHMNECGACVSCMTGSGSAVFGIFTDIDRAEKCVVKLKRLGYFAVVCKTVDKSFQEIN